jgi:putative mRNA 3-end processing factor
MALIEFTNRGLYCPAGDFFIDPSQGGSTHYLCHKDCKPLLELRLGKKSIQTLAWEEPILINGVRVSLHPAGHVIGSSQVRVEYQGEVWVASGDYKIQDDGISGTFQPVKCHFFITESTFALPVYKWKEDPELFGEMGAWIEDNKSKGKTSILQAYSIGKAQRVISNLAGFVDQVYAQTAIFQTQEALEKAGFDFPNVRLLTAQIKPEALRRSLVVATGLVAEGSILKNLAPYSMGICSGWERVSSKRRGQLADTGFALSDHADWEGLLAAVKETGAEKVFVTHGFQSEFTRYLNEIGIPASEVNSGFSSEEEDIYPINPPS